MTDLLYLGPSGRQLWSKHKEGWQISTATPLKPVWVVTDFPEESFAEIELPRLFGRDRSIFIARQLASRFPDTPYRAVLTPAGQTGLLEKLAPSKQIFLAVNNAERLNTELGNVPVTGIWPLSLLISLFCLKHKLPGDLLVILPEPEALRIVYLKNRTPVLTRLVSSPNQVQLQVEEIIRTRRYLENTRMVERGQICPALLLGSAENFAAPLSAAQFELVAPPPPWNRHPPPDWRFPFFDLARRSPPGQVAPLTLRIDHLARCLRQGAFATAALCLVAAVWSASENLQVVFNTLGQREQAVQETRTVQTQLAALEQQTKHFGVDPELLRRAIALDEQEVLSVPAFSSHLETLAQTLSSFTGLRLKQLEWRLLAAGAPACSQNQGATENAAPASPPPAGTSTGSEAQRLIELSVEIALPSVSGPSEQASILRRLSEKLAKIDGARLLRDPAKELDQGTLQSGAAREAGKSHGWCLSLPGKTPTPPSPPEKGRTP